MAASSCLFLFACTASTPGDTDGRKALQTQLGGRVENGSVKIISFKKTNGQLSPGGAEYKMDWEAEVECARPNKEVIIFVERPDKPAITSDKVDFNSTF
jgi:hypothetical protein